MLHNSSLSEESQQIRRFPHTPLGQRERIMSTGTTPPVRRTFADKAGRVCLWVVGVWVACVFLRGLFFCGGCPSSEQFNPHKMSQVPRIWPRSAWAAPQEERRVTQPNLLGRALQNVQTRLQNELESIPQDTEDREWKYKPWHGPIPQRREPQPFQLYSPDCERQ